MKQLVPTVITAAAITALGALAPGASSAIAHREPIVVETHRDGGAGRVFTLVDVGRAPKLVADSGSAVPAVDRRTTQLRGHRRFRRLGGTELLRGARGSLTLRWIGQQSSADGLWSRIAGSWTLVDGTGAYAGFAGRGEFVADERLVSGRFSGLLITAL